MNPNTSSETKSPLISFKCSHEKPSPAPLRERGQSNSHSADAIHANPNNESLPVVVLPLTSIRYFRARF